MRRKVTIPVVMIIWLIIGLVAAAQRGYFSDSEFDCNDVGTILVTTLAGPLNYVGVDPEIDCPGLPEPSE